MNTIEIIEQALEELAELLPRQIAEKFSADGHLQCQAHWADVMDKAPSTSCPVHNYLMARFESLGLPKPAITVGNVSLSVWDQWVAAHVALPFRVSKFISWFDSGAFGDIRNDLDKLGPVWRGAVEQGVGDPTGQLTP